MLHLLVCLRQPDTRELWLPERDAFLWLWIFHEPLTAPGLELIGRDFAIAIDVNQFEVDDVRHGLILRDGCAGRHD
jgi:hypothetical protein